MNPSDPILNLITDTWIPVQTREGTNTIRPDQIAEDGVIALDWPRADFNTACTEFLIGLLYLAYPPTDLADWERKSLQTKAGDLQTAFAPWAPYFCLGGPGPRFLQEFESPIATDPKPPDILFIDAAGENAVKKNKDVMQHRDRYKSVGPAHTAMALYTLQAHAPSGGAGNRTSMRGGGPMVTLAEPLDASDRFLWDMVWLNVPFGGEFDPIDAARVLPWCRKTVDSREKTSAPVTPKSINQHDPETFFGQPRKIELDWDEGVCDISNAHGPVVVGVRQQPYGTNYAGWKHPLTPHSRKKAGDEWLPMHPNPGYFSYNNWAGTVLDAPTVNRTIATCIRDARDRVSEFTIFVSGWDMDNATPRDFLISREPMVTPPDQGAFEQIMGMISAAGLASWLLANHARNALGDNVNKGETLAALKDAFYRKSEYDFRKLASEIERTGVQKSYSEAFLKLMRETCMDLFDDFIGADVFDIEPRAMHRTVTERGNLERAFHGITRKGADLFRDLCLEPPVKQKRTKQKKDVSA